jgi:hypothetical protein
VLAVLSYVAHLVAKHTIAVVEQQGMLPRWDLATHLVSGWTDYSLLITGRIHRLLWDLWLQGYWPPLHSVYQIPFYVVLGGTMRAGLWSSLTAFVLAGLTGSVVLWRQWGRAAYLPACVFVALLMSSPFILAYASVTMSEMLGAWTQLLVILCYVMYRQAAGPGTARAFAVSLTILFFTKYNYFLLLVVPLVLCEWLERTSGATLVQRLQQVAVLTRRLLTSSVTGVVLAIYAVLLFVILRSGGFDFDIGGRRISVHTVGNTGYVVLFFVLARIWSLNRRGRIDWERLLATDPRVRPLLLWFGLPVAVWFASPYPNHMRDFANLVFNRPLGERGTGGGIAAYIDALRTTYFFGEWVLALVIAVFIVAALRYSRQPAWVRWLILAVPLQFIAIVVHQTRFPRFLLLTVVLLCLVVASEAGRWASGSRGRRAASALLAPVFLALGISAATTVVRQERFQRVAFENYTNTAALADALSSIRRMLTPQDRLAIVGESNDLSPALFRWQLGPPSGVSCFPFQIGGARRLDPSLATRVLLIQPRVNDPGFALDLSDTYRAQRQAILDRAGNGELALRRELQLPEMQVTLQIYDRTRPPERLVACD